MTAAEDGPEWPDGILFWPTRQIPFQVDFIAQMYAMRNAMLAADMGTGKSVMALGVAGLGLELGEIDHVLIVAELNKIAPSEWPSDFRKFTRIPHAVYHGPKRKALLENLPAAIITTYETCRDDIAVFPAKGSGKRALSPGPLMRALEGKRVLVIYDEITKLGRRSSNLYKAHYWMLQHLRASSPGTRAIGLSGTPMDTDLENIFNEMRILVPSMPRVKDFEEHVIAGRDEYGRPRYKRGGKEWLRGHVEPWILRKRKSDPDVRDAFPPLTEEFTRLRMKPDQYRLYRQLEDLAWDNGERQEVPGLRVLLRQLAGDPLAVLEAARAGESGLAVMIAEELGPELARCSSAKAEELISLADIILAAGQKMMVFTFFGQTVLPALRKRLGDRPVYAYHGGLTPAQREEQMMLFRDHPGGAIMVLSDAGARGINAPWVNYIAEYEPARTFATRQQRAARGHRLGKEDPLTFITFVLESTIEGASSIRSLLARNDMQDFILGDTEADVDGFVTAADRRSLFAQARPRKAG